MPQRYLGYLKIFTVYPNEGSIVKSDKSNNLFNVKWDQASRDVYVSCSGGISLGKASSALEAMNKAEAYIYNK